MQRKISEVQGNAIAADFEEAVVAATYTPSEEEISFWLLYLLSTCKKPVTIILCVTVAFVLPSGGALRGFFTRVVNQ